MRFMILDLSILYNNFMSFFYEYVLKKIKTVVTLMNKRIKVCNALKIEYLKLNSKCVILSKSNCKK